MSTDSAVLACPVCGSDRISAAIDGELYCGECNRIYAVIESHLSEYGPSEAAPKSIESPHNVRHHKRIA
jgi:hypothetical protein